MKVEGFPRTAEVVFKEVINDMYQTLPPADRDLSKLNTTAILYNLTHGKYLYSYSHFCEIHRMLYLRDMSLPQKVVLPKEKKPKKQLQDEVIKSNELHVTFYPISSPSNCFYCEALRPTTRDHVYPKHLGGKKGNNLVHSCKWCNQLKGGFELSYFKEMLNGLSKRKRDSGDLEMADKYGRMANNVERLINYINENE